MSCTTELFSRRGSVLMEFVIVLPIYLTFLGAVFITGEMALKSIQLASTERSVAHEQNDGNWSFPVFQMARVRQFFLGTVDAVTGSSTHLVADTGYKGPWAQAIAGRATDYYRSPTWTRSWLQYPGLKYGISETWGAVKSIVSKDVGNGQSYNYYSYLRVPGTRGLGYRSWKPKELMGTLGDWLKVYREPYLSDTADGNDIDNKGGSDGENPPSDPGKKADYERFDPFVGWSD